MGVLPQSCSRREIEIYRGVANRYVSRSVLRKCGSIGSFDLSATFARAREKRIRKTQAHIRVVNGSWPARRCVTPAVYSRARFYATAGIDPRGRIEFLGRLAYARCKRNDCRARYTVVATAAKLRAIGFHSDCVDAINVLLITCLSFGLRYRDGQSRPLCRTYCEFLFFFFDS